MKYSLATLGCKGNQYESCAVAAALERLGLRRAGPGRDNSAASLAVVNTCCLTAGAMRKSRNIIRRAVRAAPGAVVLIAGCYCDYDAPALRELLAAAGVQPDRAFLAGHGGNLRETIEQAASAARASQWRDNVCMSDGQNSTYSPCGPDIKPSAAGRVNSDLTGTRNLGPIERFDEHCRAFVKVQDGCDAFCSYCVVPLVRTRIWSRSIDEVTAECRALAANGHREIVLCGIFLGAFGRPTAARRKWDKAPSQLPELLRRIAAVDGLWRVRLSSLEPLDLTDELLEACASLKNFSPQFHLPLQSGSPAVLERMNRKYTVEQYFLAVERLRKAFDRPAVTTDIIVGFPGEADADFRRTLDAAERAAFAEIHAFAFSPVDGTAAAKMKDAPPPQIVKERMAELAKLADRMAMAYRGSFVGAEMEAIVENPPSAARRDGALCRAMTDRHMAISFRAPSAAARPSPTSIVRLRLDHPTADGFDGVLI